MLSFSRHSFCWEAQRATTTDAASYSQSACFSLPPHRPGAASPLIFDTSSRLVLCRDLEEPCLYREAWRSSARHFRRTSAARPLAHGQALPASPLRSGRSWADGWFSIFPGAGSSSLIFPLPRLSSRFLFCLFPKVAANAASTSSILL